MSKQNVFLGLRARGTSDDTDFLLARARPSLGYARRLYLVLCRGAKKKKKTARISRRKDGVRSEKMKNILYRKIYDGASFGVSFRGHDCRNIAEKQRGKKKFRKGSTDLKAVDRRVSERPFGVGHRPRFGERLHGALEVHGPGQRFFSFAKVSVAAPTNNRPGYPRVGVIVVAGRTAVACAAA